MSWFLRLIAIANDIILIQIRNETYVMPKTHYFVLVLAVSLGKYCETVSQVCCQCVLVMLSSDCRMHYVSQFSNLTGATKSIDVNLK